MKSRPSLHPMSTFKATRAGASLLLAPPAQLLLHHTGDVSLKACADLGGNFTFPCDKVNAPGDLYSHIVLRMEEAMEICKHERIEERRGSRCKVDDQCMHPRT